MALVPKLALSQTAGCRRFRVFERTGAYTVLNTTGYGAPNAELVDVARVVLTITDPAEEDHQLDITADFAAVFPTTDSSVALELSNTDIGVAVDASIPYGIYKFTIQLYDVSDVLLASNVQYFIFDCVLKCCLDELFATLDTCDCCNDPKTKSRNLQVRMAYIYLAAAEAAANCGKLTRAQALLDSVNDLCSSTGCGCS